MKVAPVGPAMGSDATRLAALAAGAGKVPGSSPALGRLTMILYTILSGSASIN